MTVSKIMLLKFTEATSIDLIEIRMVVLLVLGLHSFEFSARLLGLRFFSENEFVFGAADHS